MSWLISSNDSRFRELRLSGKSLQICSITVASRLRSWSLTEKQLAGFRVAFKDIFRIKGVRTSLCN